MYMFMYNVPVRSFPVSTVKLCIHMYIVIQTPKIHYFYLFFRVLYM